MSEQPEITVEDAIDRLSESLNQSGGLAHIDAFVVDGEPLRTLLTLVSGGHWVQRVVGDTVQEQWVGPWLDR
jgi:hypothetical protein